MLNRPLHLCTGHFWLIGDKMEAKELLQAANYAHTQGETVRAGSLAQKILERFPYSSEANDAKKLLQKIRHSPTSETSGPAKTVTPANPAKLAATNQSREVAITSIDIPFWDLVGFMVKFLIAAIPAVIIFTVIMGFILSLLTGLGLSLT